ncbi:hypothetical protein QBZ16_000051 [Prototheca wickerhamii]|uniref:Chitin-binding type-2 domain-containing protein n=1 Tax=Prototheca wickerhamii TaxID=3111 RepID=A0AAD9IKV4_PROWI|nr:hypothetical protein QBZ16_000051 [Prototheca wickerhamii]
MRIGTSTLALLALAAFACLLRPAQGHGYLAAPISRNYLHNTDYCPQCLNAGGPSAVGGGSTWPVGQHGICGDPASGPLKHEYGGVSATGTLTANYTEGQEIDIKVTITAAHLGRFGFRICVIQHPTLEKTELTEACLDQHILVQSSASTNQDPGNRWWYQDSANGDKYMKYLLPSGLTCDGVNTRCVFQWYYGTGNSCTMPDTPAQWASKGLGICGTPSTNYPEEGQTEGYYPDVAGGCDGYFYCHNVNGVDQGLYTACPAGTLFNKERSYCDWSYNVNCPGPKRSPPPPACKAKDGACTCAGKADGWYADVAGGCSGFFYCQTTNSVAKGSYTACPTGTLYSPKGKICDWAANVVCA